jgi:hypothetical protein
MARNKKSQVIGSHTTAEHHFLMTNAYQHRIQHTCVPAPAPKHDQIPLDLMMDTFTPDCPGGLKIKQKAKRYMNSVCILFVNHALYGDHL